MAEGVGLAAGMQARVPLNAQVFFGLSKCVCFLLDSRTQSQAVCLTLPESQTTLHVSNANLLKLT